MRGRSYSYSPSPPRGHRRRDRSPSPKGGRYGGRGRDGPSSLLVRNLRHDCRPEDLRKAFSQFGHLKDIYLPRDYYSGEPRGFGFIQYVDPADATDAKYYMDGRILLGRELTVVFAEENRKKPSEMRARERGGRSGYGRSPQYSRSSSRSPRYSRSPRRGSSYGRSHRSPLRSPSPRRRSYRSPSPRYNEESPKNRSPSPRSRHEYSRSASPDDRRRDGKRAYSRSPSDLSRSPDDYPRNRRERSLSD